MSYVLTSSSGLVFAFWFFLGMSAAIAFIIYSLLSWPSARRRELVRAPAYKSLWRLEIYTLTGNRFQSAPGSYREIKAAVEDLELRLKSARKASVRRGTIDTVDHEDVDRRTRRNELETELFFDCHKDRCTVRQLVDLVGLCCRRADHSSPGA